MTGTTLLAGRPVRAAAALGLAALVTLALVRVGPVAALLVAVLPVVALGLPWVVRAGGFSLYLAAFAFPLTGIPEFGRPVPLGSANVYPQDILIALAISLGALAWLTAPPGRRPRIPVPPVLGVPFALFAAVILAATIRGHASFGSSLLGQPLRLVLYAGLILCLVNVDPRRLYRALLVVFYGGTIVTLLWALYYVGAGGSQSGSADLSTGGTRVLAISTSTYAAGALFLAVLSLRLAPALGHNLLHLVMAAIAFVEVVLGFGRAVYASVALVLLVIMLLSRPVRRAIWLTAPLLLPFVLLAALTIPRFAPEVIKAAQERVAASPEQDANVRWRIANNQAVLAQVREEPIIGSGFGKPVSFYVDIESSAGFMVQVREDTGQDPHNGYVYLLAGGGVIALGAFLLLLGVFGFDTWRRFRSSDDELGKLIPAWAAATLFVMLFNAASGTTFESPGDILGIWALILAPAVVPLARLREQAVR